VCWCSEKCTETSGYPHSGSLWHLRTCEPLVFLEPYKGFSLFSNIMPNAALWRGQIVRPRCSSPNEKTPGKKYHNFISVVRLNHKQHKAIETIHFKSIVRCLLALANSNFTSVLKPSSALSPKTDRCAMTSLVQSLSDMHSS